MVIQDQYLIANYYIYNFYFLRSYHMSILMSHIHHRYNPRQTFNIVIHCNAVYILLSMHVLSACSSAFLYLVSDFVRVSVYLSCISASAFSSSIIVSIISILLLNEFADWFLHLNFNIYLKYLILILILKLLNINLCYKI